MHITPKEKQHTTKWSGGTTTELYIFPPQAKYTERDFEFRISTATVEAETSTFTSLPNYQRILMVLVGVLKVDHAGHHTITLSPLDQDIFDGGWETTAEGKVTDFNIMFAVGKKARLVSHHIKKGDLVNLSSHASFQFGYLVSGSILTNTKQPISPGDFIVWETTDKCILKADTDSTWLSIEID
jgi:uncharacterized protein